MAPTLTNTAGNTIVAFYSYSTGGAPTLTDTKGNSYTAYVQGNISTALFSGLFIATGIAGGSNTVNISTIGAGGTLLVCEFSGVAGIETSAPVSQGNPVGTLAVGPITTTVANDLVLLTASCGNAPPITNASGWSSIFNNSVAGSMNLFTVQEANTGSYSNSITVGGSPAGMIAGMVGLKGSGAPIGSNFLINSGMDGGMHPQFKGGCNS